MCDVDNDNWVETAMADNAIVASFLLTLNKPYSSSSYSSLCSSSLSPPFNLHWTVRQRRTKWHTSAANNKKTEPTRASPTTPLSWSAATTASGATATTAADGHEESSRFTKPVHTSRSKVDDQSEATANKKSRKKRSLPELLEEEKLLLTEKGDLKDKLASMHLTVEQQRAKNESLKKMKLDLVSQKTAKTSRTSLASEKAILNTPQHLDTDCSSSKLVQPQTVHEKESLFITANASSSLQGESSNQKPSFLLPDLNLPVEEEFNSDMVPEIS
ncbi:uncharacterized protein [Cicer arietinum]|uniref:Uncharacterized protein LOC101488406 isoform X2 n=1 Tax=Cicer arietinum TaxID=3827 RepID=A0A1S2Z5Q2_CICAR|nr:uncharacterized protein LOC101488406 isoform X2 [Cicer arietinum]